MEAKKAKIVAAAAASSGLLILVAAAIIWRVLGVSTAFYAVGGVGIAVTIVPLAWAVFRCAARDGTTTSSMARRAVEGEELRIEYSYLRKAAGLPARFRYEDLQAATDGFTALIGRGSSASVYKGVLADGTAVAVKRIEGSENGEREFRSEVAAIASVQHVNLVRLLGYCLAPRAGARFLVFDFIDNGSLDKWIFPRKGGQCLPWAARRRVAVDVARGLAYLHDDCRRRVLHHDVKPENILLDGGFGAVVTDFGLSTLMGREESRVVTTAVRGTRGYLAPEWLVGRGVSEKCDVFSYGMVLLEMVAGRRGVRLVGDAAQREWSYLPRVVAERAGQGRLMEVVDERLARSEVAESEVRTVAHVGLWCMREEPKARPGMAQVVDMLMGRVAVEAPPVETNMLILDLLTMDHVTVGGDGGAAARARELAGQTPAMSTYSFSNATVLSGR